MILATRAEARAACFHGCIVMPPRLVAGRAGKRSAISMLGARDDALSRPRIHLADDPFDRSRPMSIFPRRIKKIFPHLPHRVTLLAPENFWGVCGSGGGVKRDRGNLLGMRFSTRALAVFTFHLIDRIVALIISEHISPFDPVAHSPPHCGERRIFIFHLGSFLFSRCRLGRVSPRSISLVTPAKVLSLLPYFVYGIKYLFNRPK